MGFTSRNGECGRKGDDIGPSASQSNADFGETQLAIVSKPNRAASPERWLTSKHIADPTFPTGVLNGGNISIPGSTELNKPTSDPNIVQRGDLGGVLALLQHRTARDVHVEEVDLLVSLGDLTVLIDPQDGVLDLVGVEAGFVDADMYGQFLAAGFFAQAQHKLALVDWPRKAQRLLSGAGDVVGCFWEEEGLCHDSAGVMRGREWRRGTEDLPWHRLGPLS